MLLEAFSYLFFIASCMVNLFFMKILFTLINDIRSFFSFYIQVLDNKGKQLQVLFFSSLLNLLHLFLLLCISIILFLCTPLYLIFYFFTKNYNSFFKLLKYFLKRLFLFLTISLTSIYCINNFFIYILILIFILYIVKEFKNILFYYNNSLNLFIFILILLNTFCTYLISVITSNILINYN